MSEIERNEEPMQIIMAFNSNYLLPAIETIFSLFTHNSNIVLTIGYSDLSQDEMDYARKLEGLCEGNRIEYVKIEEDLEEKFGFDTGRFTIYTFYRFLVPEFLSKDVERCLWLDADLMIRKNIRMLYDIDFDGCYFAGACENSSNPLERLGFDDYINAGVLMMNLRKLRETDGLQKLWDFILDPSFDYALLDQDAINLVFRHQIRLLKGEYWNRLPFHSNEQILGGVPDLELADEAFIVHFLSKQKVWLEEYREYWIESSAMYPVAGKFFIEYLSYMEQAIDWLSREG